VAAVKVFAVTALGFDPRDSRGQTGAWDSATGTTGAYAAIGQNPELGLGPGAPGPWPGAKVAEKAAPGAVGARVAAPGAKGAAVAAPGPGVALAPPSPLGPALVRTPQYRAPGDPSGHQMVLWGVLVLAGVLYGWGVTRAELHPYYTAAVRGMASSWHAFFYGAFDPGASITLDKLPGAFWPQALSVRFFGLNVWAVALPQVVEGVVTVAVLYHVVRRWAGPAAGLLAALVLTLTPVTVALNRHNLPDSLLVMLVVIAAALAQRATASGRLAPLLGCAAVVGLGFQAKMLGAWLVVPAFAASYLLAAPGPVRRRLKHVAAAGGVLLAVSGLWLTAVALTPASQRPYVDGTTNNNPFSLVFGYNAFSRFGSPGGSGLTTGSVVPAGGGSAHWQLLINRADASQYGWLMPVALLVVACGLIWLRQAPRGDQLRAGLLMWGLWLLVGVAAFSLSNRVHAYYTSLLAPAVAALCGAGLVLLWPTYRRRTLRWWALPTAYIVGTVWAVWIGVGYSRFVPWVFVVVGLGGLGAAAALVLAERDHRPNPRLVNGAALAGAAVLLLSPTVWAVSTLDTAYAGPAISPAAGAMGRSLRAVVTRNSKGHKLPLVVFDKPRGATRGLLTYLEEHHGTQRYVVATEQTKLAEPLLRAAPITVLPIGGFSGLTPYPTVDGIADLVAQGQLRYVLLEYRPAGTAEATDNPAIGWVLHTCHPVPRTDYGASGTDAVLYDCVRGTE
jgi:4-amino-4-deoxy-L-arabinose transferase-like glycosyltransferase